MKRFLRQCALIALLVPSLFFITASGPNFLLTSQAAPAAQRTERLYFAPTGQWVGEKFLEYWQSHGGLPIFGYPLTPAFYEGGYTVQYFERSRFELHPEYAGSPYEVSLGQLGRERLKKEARAVPRPTADNSGPGDLVFPETGYKTSGAFLDYWRQYGGLAQFGFPITPELKDEGDGRTVQYFERARFEMHPEYAGTPYEVLLTLLGRERAAGLDSTLRDRWSPDEHAGLLRMIDMPDEVQVLTPVEVQSDVSGELRVLGGDNRLYARYPIEADVPLTFYAAGAPGPQSLMLYYKGQVVAAGWAAFKVATPQVGIQSGDPVWDGLYPRVKGFLEADAVDYTSPDNKPVHGYRSPDNSALWLRDHIHQSKGFKFFEKNMRSALDYFATTQRPDGSFDDYIFHTPATPVFKRQIEIEADREYLFVEGVWTAWQATGDDEWLRTMLPVMERGLEHMWSDPRRWSTEYGLIKRAFTIDTWDYEQGSDGGDTRRTLDDKTRWSIMHGDNTGAYHSARLLANMERYFARWGQGAAWDTRADKLLQNLNRVSWNGSFYIHQVHLTPVDDSGVNESMQLSLSNAYALNRGTLAENQATALIKQYQVRRIVNGSRIFSEWYSIDSPFAATFGPPGEYANGGVMPLVGGELARGAFRYGFEAYGADILKRYWGLLDKTGGSYLWYHPDGRPGIGTPETLSTDGWGSSAMLNALTEGLAGVEDEGKLYQHVLLSPKWSATDRTSARVTLGYGASGAYFAYTWQRNSDGSIMLTWGGRETSEVHLHMMLPAGFAPKQPLLGGTSVSFHTVKIGDSSYLDATLPGIGQIIFR
jgi:hypothetical protein